MAENNEKIILEQTSGTPDGGRLRGILDSRPQLRAMLDKLSPEDARKLGGILANPDKLRSVLASPQAKSAMQKLRGDTAERNSGGGADDSGVRKG